jgi:type II secretory pathway pseudopilin PulG
MMHRIHPTATVAWSRRTLARRRGISLIEVSLAIILSSVLTTLAIAAIVAAQRADRGMAERLALRRNFAEFSDRVRQDIHAAAEASWNDDQRSLRLRSVNGDWTTIKFRSERAERWQRTEQEDDQSTDEQLAGAFPMSRGLSWSVTPVDARLGQLVRIAATRNLPARTNESHTEVFEVVAEVGRDRRLLNP